MATTLSLNSSDSIMVTTYWGGVDRGRCYTFHVKLGDHKLFMDGTEKELVECLMNYFEIKVESASMMPAADNRRGGINQENFSIKVPREPLVKEVDPELEKLLDEEEE